LLSGVCGFAITFGSSGFASISPREIVVEKVLPYS